MERRFHVLLLGQVVSQAGTHMTGFALGAWIYQKSGSVSLFGLIVVAMFLPGIVLAPMAGVLVDRWDRRRLLLSAHLGAGLCSLGLAVVYCADLLGLSAVLALLLLKTSFEIVETPVLAALTTALVPSERLGRANGLLQLGTGLSHIAAPIAAAGLLSIIGMGGVFLVDLGTFVFAMLTLLLLGRGVGAEAAARERQTRAPFLREAVSGFLHLRERSDLAALMGLGALVNLDFGMMQVLFPPLVLNMGDTRTLGIIESIGGVGLLLGGGLLAVWGGPRRPMEGVLGFTFALGVMLLLAVARPSLLLAGVGILCVLSAFPFIAGCSQTIWQREISPELQGRMFAIRAMVGNAVMAVSTSLAGPLADRLFEPLLMPGGALADSIGRIIGIGPGRGVALLIASLGVLTCAIAAVVMLTLPVRNLGRSHR